MRARSLVAGAGLALAGAIGLMHADRLRSIPANIRRYSMPSAATYDLATRLVYGGRYQEIAAAIAAEIGREVDYVPVETDGAARAAARIAELL